MTDHLLATLHRFLRRGSFVWLLVNLFNLSLINLQVFVKQSEQEDHRNTHGQTMNHGSWSFGFHTGGSGRVSVLINSNVPITVLNDL